MRARLWLPLYDFAFLETIETIFRRLVVKKEGEPKMSADMDNLHPIGMFRSL